MPRFVKYILKTIGVLIALFLVLYLIAFIYVSSHKKSIIKEVTEELSKKINGNVSIDDVELSFFRSFPKVSVLLHKILVTDTMYSKYHHAIFQADEVFAQLSVVQLMKKQFPVNGLKIVRGSVYLFTDINGYTNAYLLKPKSKDTTSASSDGNNSKKNNLESIDLQDLRIIIDDKKREKLHDVLVDNLKVNLDDKDDVTIFSTKADVQVRSLAFNLPNGSFIKGKKFEGDFKFRLDKKLQQLQFDSIDIKISGQPFNITASFDLVKPDPQFTLRIHTKQILYSFGKSLLTAKIDTSLSIVDLDKKFDVDANLNGPLNGGDPYIVVNWKVKNSHLATPFIDVDDASFTGYYAE